jgi:hypothetical protein
VPGAGCEHLLLQRNVVVFPAAAPEAQCDQACISWQVKVSYGTHDAAREFAHELI